MIEHIFVTIVLWKLIRGLFLERRGRQGVISTFIKGAIRTAKKIGFVQKRLDQELSAEAQKTVGKMLDEKPLKPEYSCIP
jgi:hypothetical protein